MWGFATPAVALVVLIIIAVQARGRARGFGVAGSVLLLVGNLANAFLSIYLPLIMQRAHLPVASVSLLFVPGTFLGGVGLLLLAAAVVIGSRNQITSVPRSGNWNDMR